MQGGPRLARQVGCEAGINALAGLPARASREERARCVGGSNSVVESQPSKLLVAGSIPVSRSSLRRAGACMRRLRLGKPAGCEGGLRVGRQSLRRLSTEAREAREATKADSVCRH